MRNERSTKVEEVGEGAPEKNYIYSNKHHKLERESRTILVQSLVIHCHKETKVSETKSTRFFSLETLQATPQVSTRPIQATTNKVAHGRVIKVSNHQTH